jgi:hypothetical protein
VRETPTADKGGAMTATFPITFAAERARQANQQELVNRLAARHGDAVADRAIRFLAESENRPYSRRSLAVDATSPHQYAGYWDGAEWVVARVTVDLVSKGGVQARAGDVVLARRGSRFVGTTDYGTFYSVRLGWNCSIGYGVRFPKEGAAA